MKFYKCDKCGAVYDLTSDMHPWFKEEEEERLVPSRDNPPKCLMWECYGRIR